MLPGLLGIARTTGNNFTFIIAQDASKIGKFLHRRIIQKRNNKETNPDANYTIPPVITPQEQTETSEEILPSTEDNLLLNSREDEEENNTKETILDDNFVIHEDYEKDHEINSDTIYNHFDDEYKSSDIEEVLRLKHIPDDGKL